jgi:prepilin-type N-terminal cleavage/methylation domain-containing protein
MRPERGTAPERASGFTLIELMIGLTILSLVVVVIYGTFFRTQHAAQGVMADVDGRQCARSAVQLMERDLRMAGSGWGRMDVEGARGGAPLTLYGLNPGYGGSGGNDSISVLGAWDVNSTLSATMTTASTDIKCVSVTGFASGDLVVVTNSKSAHLFQVTSVSTSTKTLAHATSSTFNGAGGHTGWPTGGYKTGTPIYKVGWISYHMDSTTFGQRALVRYVVGSSPQMVAPGIQSFQVWYQLDDGARTRDIQDLSALDQVIPILYPNGAAGSAPQADSVWTVVQPRTF